MEKPRTQTEQRRAEFNRHAAAARDLGDTALAAIDAALAEQGELYEQLQMRADQNGGITDEDVERELGRAVQTSPNFYQ